MTTPPQFICCCKRLWLMGGDFFASNPVLHTHNSAKFAVLLFLHLAIVGCQPNPPIDYKISFRNSHFDEESFRLLGSRGVKAWDYIHRDPEGLRMVLPENVDAQMVGFATRRPIQGDFEITMRYEIVTCGQPSSGFGAGPGIYLKTQSSNQAVAVLSRLKRTEEGDVYNAYRGLTRTDGTVEHRPVLTNTTSTAGRLRLIRNGAVLNYLVSDGESDKFRTIHRVDFVADDVTIVRFAVDRGGANVAVEVVFTDLTIRSGERVHNN